MIEPQFHNPNWNEKDLGPEYPWGESILITLTDMDLERQGKAKIMCPFCKHVWDFQAWDGDPIAMTPTRRITP